VHTGHRGRPRLVDTAGLLGQEVKHRAVRFATVITRRLVRGTAATLQATGSGTGINTASIERLNAMSHGASSASVRHGRTIAATPGSSPPGWIWRAVPKPLLAR
jgi:hypothetical protein